MRIFVLVIFFIFLRNLQQFLKVNKKLFSLMFTIKYLPQNDK